MNRRPTERRDLRREAELAVIGSLLSITTRESTIEAVKKAGLEAAHFASRDTATAFAQILADARTEWGIMDTSAEAIGGAITDAKLMAEIGREKKAVEKVLDNARQAELFRTITGVTEKVANYPTAIAAGRALQDALKKFDRDAQRRAKVKGRTLSSFAYPGPDEEDDDCLFQNRWLRRGMAGMIVAGSGVGKSVVSLQLAYHWAVGKPCLGVKPVHKTAETCKAGRSLPDGGMKIAIFQAEDDEYDMQKFRRGITNGLLADGWTQEEVQLAEKRIVTYGLDEIGGMDLFTFMSAVQDEERFDLAFINPLFGFYDGDIKDNEAARRWLRDGLDPLIKRKGREFGCFIVHHTAKPKAEDLKDAGNAFASYMGNGASEFTNYPRVTLSFVPWKSRARGSVPSRVIYRLVAGKHSDQLGWKRWSGSMTDEKIVCYSYLVPRFKDKHAIYWAEPDEEEWRSIVAKQAEETRRANAEREAEGAPSVLKSVTHTAPAGLVQSDLEVVERTAIWVGSSGGTKTPDELKAHLGEAVGCGPKATRVARMYAQLVTPSNLERLGLEVWVDGRNKHIGTTAAIRALKAGRPEAVDLFQPEAMDFVPMGGADE